METLTINREFFMSIVCTPYCQTFFSTSERKSCWHRRQYQNGSNSNHDSSSSKDSFLSFKHINVILSVFVAGAACAFLPSIRFAFSCLDNSSCVFFKVNWSLWSLVEVSGGHLFKFLVTCRSFLSLVRVLCQLLKSLFYLLKCRLLLIEVYNLDVLGGGLSRNHTDHRSHLNGGERYKIVFNIFIFINTLQFWC